jgi:hypothetical protein
MRSSVAWASVMSGLPSQSISPRFHFSTFFWYD